MDSRQFINSKDLKSAKNTSPGRNGKSKPSAETPTIADNKKNSDNYYMLRLKEIEAHNIQLEELVQKQKRELTEIITTHNKFISILAHDLRSPFSSILAALDILTKNIKEYDILVVERYIKIATNSANNTLSLLDNLLVWIISQHQGDNFNPVKIDLHNLLLEEIENLTSTADQKHISLVQNIAEDLKITADRQMVKTILRNLINNAIKYTHNFGLITISAMENNQYVEIAIEDNGIGISFEAQKELFKIDSFQSTIGTKNERGTGLGLIICKDFVDKHGGNIWIESEPGKGSEFKFTLPHYI
jgi:signal transduction histidine kinase